MIDFHSHIVYGVDDGSETLENSIEILKHAEKAGFHSIILTPHYMKNYYEISADEIQEKISSIPELIKQFQRILWNIANRTEDLQNVNNC